ncbi:MAG: hypothetical protein LBD33_01015 [Puniceicoccales bacterium]|nr:hypothetical protein [Puniceicoccales bacterium]
MAVFAVAGWLLVGVDMQSTGLKEAENGPPVKLVCGDLAFQYRATDSFFIPTEYGEKYRIHKPKIGEGDKYRSKPIFSELDKIRIFNVFLKNFSESEYWVMSRLNLRQQNCQKMENRSFVAAAECSFAADYGIGKFYDSDTQILFKSEPDER